MTHNAKAKELFESGMVSFSQENWEQSIADFSRAVDADPEFEMAYLSRGAALTRVGKAGEAIADFDKVVEMNPTNRRAYNLRGVARTAIGEYEQAVKDFTRAIDLDPEYGAAYLGRANAHGALGHDEAAQADMQLSVQIGHKNLQTYANETNIWQSEHLRLEAEGIASEIHR